MSIIKYRWYWAWDYDKEEKWLNEMSEKGLQLTKVKAIRYKFDEGKINEYTYRIEMLDELPCNKKSQEYISFLEETGVEMIGSYIRWVYLRKKKSDGDFDLFSDLDSRINHLTRILYFLAFFIPVELMYALKMWSKYSIYKESYIILIALLVSLTGILLILGVSRIYRKRKKLKQERCLHE